MRRAAAGLVISLLSALLSGGATGAGCGHYGGGSAFDGFERPAAALTRLAHRIVELGVAAQAELDRVLRLDIDAVPMGALAHRVDRRLGRAEQLGNLAVAQLAVALEQPGDGVGPILALRNRRIAAAPALRRRGQFCRRSGQLELGLGIGLTAFELFAGQLAVLHRVEADDANGDFTVGNAGNLERVHLAEHRDLLEGQRRVVDQPDSGRLGHERRFSHVSLHRRRRSRCLQGHHLTATGCVERRC